MEQTPAPSRMPHSETSPLVYHEMQNGYAERGPYIPSQHMNHSQSPLSIRTNYGPPTPHFKVQMWQQPIFDSGFQSMQHSQSASLMSYPAGSEMSAMSMMDQAELTDIQQQKFDSIPSGSAAIPQLLQVMREGTESEITRALNMIQKIAKLDQRGDHETNIQTTDVIHAIAYYLRESSSDQINRAALSALFHICSREPGLSLLFSFIDNGGSDIVRLITNKIEGRCSSVKKYAILILHSVLSDRRRNECLEKARRSGALRNITSTLEREQSQKLLSVAVDILRILFEDNRKEQTEFISLNGIPILLNILQVQNYENLLHSVTGLIKQLCNLFGAELVKHQVPMILSEQLKHSSERLIIRSLETIRNLSDVCSREPNQTKVLRNLIRLLGCDNPKIVLFTVQALGNMSANNETNKSFLESNNVVNNLLLMMYHNNIHMQNITDHMNKKTMEELNDAVLVILRHLCCGHPKAEKVQSFIFQQPGIFFDQLRSMRPVLIKDTLQLLNRLTNHDNNLTIFKMFGQSSEQHMYGFAFIEQIVYILRICCNQIAEKNIEIERVQVCELATSCLSILESLCRDRDIFEKTVDLLKTHNSEYHEPLLGHMFLPTFLLQQTIVDNPPMKRAAMSLIVVLISHKDIASIFNAKELRSYLTHCINGTNRDLAVLAEKACRILMLGGAPPVMSCPPYREKPYHSHSHSYEGSMYHQSDIMNQGHHSGYSHHMSGNHGAPRASPVPEPMEGAGEQFPEMSCIDDPSIDNPFATVFNNTAHTSPLYSSPSAAANEVMMNSPTQNQWSSMNPSSSTPPQPPVSYHRRTHAYPPDPTHQPWDDFNPIPYGHSEVAPYNHAYEYNRRPEIPGADLSNNIYHSSHPQSTYYQNHLPHNQYYNQRDNKHNT